jgi:hypothetical protein
MVKKAKTQSKNSKRKESSDNEEFATMINEYYDKVEKLEADGQFNEI